MVDKANKEIRDEEMDHNDGYQTEDSAGGKATRGMEIEELHDMEEEFEEGEVVGEDDTKEKLEEGKNTNSDSYFDGEEVEKNERDDQGCMN